MLLTRDRSEHREKRRQKTAGDAIDPRRHRKSADMNTVDRISPWKKSGSAVVTRRGEAENRRARINRCSRKFDSSNNIKNKKIAKNKKKLEIILK